MGVVSAENDVRALIDLPPPNSIPFSSQSSELVYDPDFTTYQVTTGATQVSDWDGSNACAAIAGVSVD